MSAACALCQGKHLADPSAEPSAAPAAWPTSRRCNPGHAITQACLLECVLASPPKTPVKDLFDFKRPFRAKEGVRKCQALQLTDEQENIMYALSGCSDVNGLIRNVKPMVRDLLKGEHFNMTDANIALWFKNRAGKPKRKEKLPPQQCPACLRMLEQGSGNPAPRKTPKTGEPMAACSTTSAGPSQAVVWGVAGGGAQLGLPLRCASEPGGVTPPLPTPRAASDVPVFGSQQAGVSTAPMPDWAWAAASAAAPSSPQALAGTLPNFVRFARQVTTTAVGAPPVANLSPLTQWQQPGPTPLLMRSMPPAEALRKPIMTEPSLQTVVTDQPASYLDMLTSLPGPQTGTEQAAAAGPTAASWRPAAPATTERLQPGSHSDGGVLASRNPAAGVAPARSRSSDGGSSTSSSCDGSSSRGGGGDARGHSGGHNGTSHGAGSCFGSNAYSGDAIDPYLNKWLSSPVAGTISKIAAAVPTGRGHTAPGAGLRGAFSEGSLELELRPNVVDMLFRTDQTFTEQVGSYVSELQQAERQGQHLLGTEHANTQGLQEVQQQGPQQCSADEQQQLPSRAGSAACAGNAAAYNSYCTSWQDRQAVPPAVLAALVQDASLPQLQAAANLQTPLSEDWISDVLYSLPPRNLGADLLLSTGLQQHTQREQFWQQQQQQQQHEQQQSGNNSASSAADQGRPDADIASARSTTVTACPPVTQVQQPATADDPSAQGGCTAAAGTYLGYFDMWQQSTSAATLNALACTMQAMTAPRPTVASAAGRGIDSGPLPTWDSTLFAGCNLSVDALSQRITLGLSFDPSPAETGQEGLF